jgi:dihydrofolate reductase
MFAIEAHAVISDDDCICDASGVMPASIRSDADWAYFQAHLDSAAIVITGRHGHEAHPNKPGRQRLVFTSKASGGFERKGDVAWVDPARFDLHQAFSVIAPRGGIVAVTGGGPVFDWFAQHLGFDAFHLVRAHGALIPGGRPMFSSGRAEPTLHKLGMHLSDRRWLSEPEQVELLLFKR